MQESERWISKKELVIPVMSIIAFLLLIGSASYAYYTQAVGGTTAAANISNANLVVPRGCTFLSTATNCTITSNNATTTAFTDAVITRAEMAQAYAGNRVATKSCALNIGVQGTAGCKCTYSVSVAGTTTTNFIAGSIKASITSTNTAHSKTETDMSSLSTIVSSNVLQVATTGTAVYENFSVVLNVYNINESQNNQASVKYSYYLRATPSSCTVS